MDEQSVQKNSLTVPIAIVIAGVLIAGALYLSRGGSTQPATSQGQDTQAQPTVNREIIVRPVSTRDHILGNPDAPVGFIVYTDLECPFCKSFHNTMHKIVDTYGKDGKVAWVYRSFPLPQLHPKAPAEAVATECVSMLAGNTAYWSYVDSLFQITPSNNGLDLAELPKLAKNLNIDESRFTACSTDEKNTAAVQKDYEEAISAGGQGTPFSVIVSAKPLNVLTLNKIKTLTTQYPPDTFVFSTDNKRIAMSGALPYETVSQVIEAILAN